MDIIFFAAIAFFIFYKLSKEFGKIDESEKAEIQKKLLKKREEFTKIQQQILKQPGATAEIKVVGEKDSAKNEEKFFAQLDEANRKNFVTILERSKITAEFFVQGAKTAFEMIVKAFAAADLDMLKFLLSEKIFKGFEAAINGRKSEEKSLVTNLISIEKSDVISALILDNFAVVTMKIVSKQINYVTNKTGEIVQGRKDEIAEVTDVWTFKRDLNSQSPNWIVSSTNS
jgi:predicted lipid-binding transport protein (Tim44 family)